MNPRRPIEPRGRQRGWSLVEAVMVLLLMGVMSTGLWKTMEVVGKKQSGEQSRDVMQRAEDALYGMVLRDMRLPMPEDASVSLERPFHFVGWLPERVLGTEPPRSIRYIVDRDLVEPPGALRFQADPMGLIPNPPPPAPPFLAPRVEANGLDLCLRIIRREAAAVAMVQGVNLAFGVQQVAKLDTLGEASPAFQFGNDQAAAGETNSELKSRAAGHIEMVHRLGCIQGFARLTTEVKSAALFNDLYTIARINTDLKGLELQAARDFLRSHQWRRRVAMTNVTISGLRIITNLVAMSTTPAGAAIAAANLAPQIMALMLWAELVQLSDTGAAANAGALPGLQQAHDQARAYADHLVEQRDRHVARANEFQVRGVQP